MNRIPLVLALLLAALPASADVLVTSPLKVPVGKGSAGPVAVKVLNSDRTTRDVASATGTITVYSTSPSGSFPGTVWFTKALAPSGTAGWLVGTYTTSDSAKGGEFYMVVTVTEGSVVDTFRGFWKVEGR